MRRAILALAFVLAAGVACAQGLVGGIPFQFTPLTPGQHGITPTVSTALTVPAGARYAFVCASVQAARYTTDGTTVPTLSVGTLIPVGSCQIFSGITVLTNFRAFQAVAGTVLDIEYFQ